MFPRIENASFAETTTDIYRPYPKHIDSFSIYHNKIANDTDTISSLKKLKDYLCEEETQPHP